MNDNELKEILKNAKQLYSGKEVDEAISSMADSINDQLSDKRPLVLPIMCGGLVTAGKLLPLLDFVLEVDYIHATRYFGHESPKGEIEWLVKPRVSLKDRTVLLVDDILDVGQTLLEVKKYCEDQGAKEVFTAVLADKNHNRKAIPDLKADFTGLTVEDYVVFGSGMDYKGFWRNANGIYAIR